MNPYVSAEEQEKLKQAVRDAAAEGVFTPSSHLRYHIQFPGAWGGANWGSTAADPATGMLFVRSLEMPSYRKMSLSVPQMGRGAGGRGESQAPERSPREQQGYATYMQFCSICHGPGQTPMRATMCLRCPSFCFEQEIRRSGEVAFDLLISCES